MNTLHAPSVRARRIALLLLTLSYMLSVLDRMILSVLFEPIRQEFGLSDTQLGLLGGLAFAIFYATLGIPIARYAERSSRRLIIAASLLVFSVATALSGLATSFAMLVMLRVVVGIGEAGVNPSSQSILADYFPADRLASAMSILMLGSVAGSILGLGVGGYVSANYGWRYALFIAGLPGMVMAACVFLFLKEPQRPTAPTGSPKKAVPTTRATASYILSNKAMCHMLIGATLSAIQSYGAAQWFPTFFMRIHDVPQERVGAILAVLFGVFGTLGTVLSGFLVDRLSRRNPAYGIWMIGAVQMFAFPLAVAAYYAGSLTIALGLMVVPIFVSTFYLGPTLALTQSLSPRPMRTIAAALKMLLFNLIGLGLGPLVIGLLSDALQPLQGEDSLRTALALCNCLTVWAAFHFWICGRNLKRGLAQAAASDIDSVDSINIVRQAKIA